MPTKLTDDQIQTQLRELPGWSLQNNKLHWSHKFADFNEAWGFMARVALIAEAMGHHPEWFNVWANVTIDLATHDVGGISELDFQLAQKINQLAQI